MLSELHHFKKKIIFLKGRQLMMKENELREIWEQEEHVAHIRGWDFSHIRDRYEEGRNLPWNYRTIVEEYRKDWKQLLDYDTGGAEFLLYLHHPYDKTAATEGYEPNVALCREKLIPLGIDFRKCDNPSDVPYEDASFDLILNRHGEFDPLEIKRLLARDGILLTQQVGCDNDRDLVEMVLPGLPKPFPDMNLAEQRHAFEQAGFQILRAEEAYRPIKFYDVGAFVWFAHIIEWEFPDFSVDRCFERLLEMQRVLERDGVIQGTIHRYLICAQKK